MIDRITGKVAKVGPAGVVLETGGIGFGIMAPLSTSSKLSQNDNVTLFTELVVRADSMSLFGFLTERERVFFNHLRSVAGVGPKLACTVLSGMTADSLMEAVHRGEPAMLARVPGIGKKTAGRIIMEFSGKVESVLTQGAGMIPSSRESVDALVSLGYQRNMVSRVVEEILEELGPEATVEQIIRKALSLISGKTSRKGRR